MNEAQKILMIVGAAFSGVGTMITIVFAGVGMGGVFLTLPIFFILLGISFIVGVFYSLSQKKKVLPGEDELMDDKPVAPDKLQIVAVTCPNCGSNFQAATGYSSKCPYCGGYINV